jgi:hypothetical protein
MKGSGVLILYLIKHFTLLLHLFEHGMKCVSTDLEYRLKELTHGRSLELYRLGGRS